MPDRLLYSVPTGRHPRIEFAMSMRGIEVTCRSFERRAHDWAFSVGPVQMARSHIVGRAIDEEYDYLVMHDDDLMVSPVGEAGNPLDAFHDIMNSNPSVGMIGAAYMGEHVKLPLATIPHPDYPGEHGVPEEVIHVAAGLPNAPMEVAGVGTGFVMIRVSALKALREAEKATGGGPPFKFQVRKNRFGAMVEVGEDYDFCQRLRSVGYKILVDPRFPTIHFKSSGELVYEWKAHEDLWSGESRANEIKRIGELCAPGNRLIQVGNVICVDHTPSRKRDGEAAQREQAEALAKRSKEAA